MNKIYIAIIILIVLIGGGVFIFGMGKKAEAPTPEIPIVDNNQTSPVMCTMEAKLCPDGSYVGRSGPKCEFTPCPEVKNTIAPALKEFTIEGKNFSFTPSLITVKKGDRVKITFKNMNGNHDLRIDEFKVATNIIKGGNEQTIEFVADKSGSFQYYCSVGTHKAMGMWGTLKVE